MVNIGFILKEIWKGGAILVIMGYILKGSEYLSVLFPSPLNPNPKCGSSSRHPPFLRPPTPLPANTNPLTTTGVPVAGDEDHQEASACVSVGGSLVDCSTFATAISQLLHRLTIISRPTSLPDAVSGTNDAFFRCCCSGESRSLFFLHFVVVRCMS